RSALAPDMPTIAESGLPGYEGILWLRLVAASGTPKGEAGKRRTTVPTAHPEGGDRQARHSFRRRHPLARDDRALQTRRDRARRQYAGSFRCADHARDSPVAGIEPGDQDRSRLT